MMIKKYNDYIIERIFQSKNSTENIELGDVVRVIDKNATFPGIKGKVSKISPNLPHTQGIDPIFFIKTVNGVIPYKINDLQLVEKNPGKKITMEDPYGEEDWDDERWNESIKESKSNKFKVGDMITCIKDHIMVNFYGDELTAHHLDLTVGKDYRIEDITPSYKNKVSGYESPSYIWIRSDNDRLGNTSNYAYDEDIFSTDKEKIEKAKNIRKENKKKEKEKIIQRNVKYLKMRDVDPYGEEEWED